MKKRIAAVLVVVSGLGRGEMGPCRQNTVKL